MSGSVVRFSYPLMEVESPLRLGWTRPHDECDPRVLWVRVRTGMCVAFLESRCFGPRRPSEAVEISRSSAPFFSPPPPLGASARFGDCSTLIGAAQCETYRVDWEFDGDVDRFCVDGKHALPWERLTALPALLSFDFEDCIGAPSHQPAVAGTERLLPHSPQASAAGSFFALMVWFTEPSPPSPTCDLESRHRFAGGFSRVRPFAPEIP